MKLAKYVLGIALAAATLAANATSFLEVTNRSATGTTTSAHDVLGAGVTFDIGQLSLNLGQGVRAALSFTLVGKESGWTNQFYGRDGQLAFDNREPIGKTHTDSYSYGATSLLSFAFRPFASADLFENVSNDSSRSANWGIVLNPDRLSGILLFDDSGAGPDRDYDDTVVNFRLMMQPVPEPAIVTLMLAGIVVLVLVSRRRRSV